MFEPRERGRSIRWFCDNVFTPDGRPYDHGAYPHIGAPGGPCDALDDPAVINILLQWASRLGKTFFGQAATMREADTNPCPMMFVSESEKLATEVVARTYKMLERCPPLRHKLNRPDRRKQSQIEFPDCRVYVGWARSVSTLSDKGAALEHGNEIDKWEHESTSKEADPLKLVSDRGKEYPRRKCIFESTPAIKNHSRIERCRLASTNCSLHVPCPHCREYQTLRMGKEGEERGGIKWERLDTGKSDRETARRTAYYSCIACDEKILDEHRAWMMRRGVWAPEGCRVDSAKALALTERLINSLAPNAKGSDGADSAPAYEWRGWSHADWIIGTPPVSDRDAGYHLSSLYALSLGWGDIAAEFVESKERTQNLRNFVNQWLADTWELIERRTVWQELGDKIIDNKLPRGIVPVWASLLTVGVDRQSAGGDRFPFVVDAWGPGRQTATIIYGEALSFAELRQAVIDATFPHADGGAGLKPLFTLVDSGHRAEGVYEFCREMIRDGFHVWPCKGSNRALDSDYWANTLSKNSSMPGMRLYHVDTRRTQSWIDRVLHVIKPGEDGAFTLHAGSLQEHQDILEQLLNDAAVQALDSSNNARENWERINTNVPNDFRDAKRYAYTAMLIATRGATIWPRSAPEPAKKAAVISTGRTNQPRW